MPKSMKNPMKSKTFLNSFMARPCQSVSMGYFNNWMNMVSA